MFAKKNLIAVAALATLAVSAQAQSSVTLYGNLDVAVSYTKNPEFVKGSVTGVDSSILTESFFGLKGQEDLGGGLKAVFKLESSIAVDTGEAVGGAAGFWDKNAYVGVAGDFGTVKLGNQESLFKTAQAAYNPFGTTILSPVQNLTTTLRDVVGVSTLDLTGSWNNAIGYESNSIEGLTFAVQHSAREASTGAYNGGATAASVNYAAGALGVSAVYGDVRSTTGVLGSVAERNRTWLLGASYDLGVAKGFAQYGQDKLDAADVTVKVWQLGAVAPVTQSGAVHVAYGQVRVDGGKAQQFSLAYHHTLSKRTSAYAGLAFADADGASNNITTLAVGVRHAF